MREHGPWKIKATDERYQDEFLTLQVDDVVQPDGEEGSYATVRMKPGACVLAVDEEGHVHLTRQFRYATGRESLEVVAGGMDEGEAPLECARRELEEELGIRAEEWRDLGRYDLDTSMVNCPLHLYLAEGLQVGEPHTEATEDIRRVRMSFSEALDAVLEGRITHSPSCLLILKAARLRS